MATKRSPSADQPHSGSAHGRGGLSRDVSGGARPLPGLVLFGTTEEGAHTILPLTPYDENHLDAITDAFEKAEAAHANEGSANLEAAIARADQMLDDAFAETGGSSDYQTLAIVSDGMATSWGIGEQQTFNYDYAGGTNEPTDDFLRGHVQRILDLLSHCYIDTDGDGTKEKFDGGVPPTNPVPMTPYSG